MTTAHIELQPALGHSTGWDQWRKVVLGLLVCVLLVSVRVIGLGHYPATHPDEGFWASGPRNAAKFGQPLLDGRLHPFLSPATYVGLRVLFAFVTPDLVTARLFSVGMGLLSCLVAWQIGHTQFKARPWLLTLLFGLSTLVVIAQRIMLLEAHELFWILLAAMFWLDGGRHFALLAGAALGVALLVKSNCIFCIPVFLGSLLLSGPPSKAQTDGSVPRQTWQHLLIFLGTCLVMATGGYLAAWAINPTGFATAFRFELDGVHFQAQDVLFHVGRFGVNPRLILTMAKAWLLAEPLLLPLALLGLVVTLRRFRSASRADTFFCLWLVFGTLFHFLQIHISSHYLATLAPAYAYLAARFINDLLDRKLLINFRRMPALAAGLLILMCVLQLARFGKGILDNDETDYWQTVQYFHEKVPSDARIMAASYIDLSLPQQSYDLFRLMKYYNFNSGPHQLVNTVDQYHISYIVVDPEWRENELGDSKAFLAERCNLLMVVGPYEVYRVQPHAGTPTH